jgi:hypothetical protein
MEKIDLGKVKTTKRIRNGVEQEIRLFNKKQRQIIMEAVENRPDGMNIEDVLNIYELSPVVYYSWLRSEKEEKKDVGDQLPNPLVDSLEKDNVFTSASQLRAFYEANSPELKAFIEKKFEEWRKTDIISQIAPKVTPKNIAEVAKAGSITIDELKSFLQRRNKDLSYYSVEAIIRYLDSKAQN